MENKRVQNTSEVSYEGIKFKSKAECTIYKALLENGLSPEYEPKTFFIFEGFTPKKVPFYTKNKFKKKNCHIHVMSPATVRDDRSVPSITYKPDFIFKYGDKTIIVEVKGFENDVFPYKFKMFRKYLEDLPDAENYELWEVFTKRQLLDCIKHLKENG